MHSNKFHIKDPKPELHDSISYNSQRFVGDVIMEVSDFLSITQFHSWWFLQQRLVCNNPKAVRIN